jgi:hypothetical protein
MSPAIDVRIERLACGLLDRIDERYPKGKLAALRSDMGSFFDAIPRADGRTPWSVFGCEAEAKPALPDGAHPWDAELVGQLQAIAEHAAWCDWYYPALSPGVVQAVIPSYFGCVEERASRSSAIPPTCTSCPRSASVRKPPAGRCWTRCAAGGP